MKFNLNSERMIHKEASNAYKYGIAYQIKKKKLPEKKIHTGKIVMCLYMWSSELGHIYLLI